MVDIWVTSDQHFQHANILGFRSSKDGPLIRPGFDDVQHMDETLIASWNKVVKPEDHIYCLGDVAMGQKNRWHLIFARLNGKKRLILGNHDHSDVSKYQPFFEKIMASRHLGDLGIRGIATHIPLHPSQFNGRTRINIHGHLHQNIVTLENGHPDTRYVNVCVEHHNYTPVHIDELKKLDI